MDAVRISLSLLIKVSPELAGGLHFHPMMKLARVGGGLLRSPPQHHNTATPKNITSAGGKYEGGGGGSAAMEVERSGGW